LLYEVLSWEQIYDMCLELGEKIKGSGYTPDIIVGIARGGWIPARIVSDILGNPDLASMKTEFYTDVGETSARPRITQNVSVSVAGKRVLVVDDVADTGKSLELIRESLIRQQASDVRIAALHCKPKSVLRPDFFVAETEAWIVYPHERFEFLKSRVEKMRREKVPLSGIRIEMLRIGIPEKVIERFLRDPAP